LLIGAIGHCADIQDCGGGVFSKNCSPTAYQGPIFADILPRVKTEIVKRCDQAKGFVTLPERWRSIAWLNRCRRLAEDWENLNTTALVVLRFASIRLILRKLCNGCRTFETDSKSFRGMRIAQGALVKV
jgi:putative transposase